MHVEAGDHLAKFWLDPVRLSHAGGFSAKEINAITDIIEQHQQTLLEAWNDYFHP